MTNEQLDKDEKELLASYDQDEWRSVEGVDEEKARYKSIAAATLD